MSFEDKRTKKLRTIKWFLRRPWKGRKDVFDKHYFAQNFAPNDRYLSLEAKDITLLNGIRECEDFVDAFQELAKRHYNDEFCWCGPQVVTAVVHAAFARILLEGSGDSAYGIMSAVNWHCFPDARLNEGLSYHGWLSALDSNSHESREGDKPYDLYDSQREAAFFIMRKIGLEPSCFEGYFVGLTKEAYAKNLELAESGQVGAVDRLIDYHLRASFFPGSREKKKNELLARELLWKYAKAASLKHCMCAGATFYVGRVDRGLRPPFWFGDPGAIDDFIAGFTPDLKRTLSCLELALCKHDSGDVTVNGWKIEKNDILLEMASLSLAGEIANGVSFPPYSQPEEVVMRAKAYACPLILPLFIASKTDNLDELAIKWGQILGIPFFLMMSSVYAWRGEIVKQYAWANLSFIECHDSRGFPLSLYPEEQVFPLRVRLSSSELEEAQELTFDLLKQLLSPDPGVLSVSRYVKFRIGLVKLSDSTPYSLMEDWEILKYALGCLCGNSRSHCSWLGVHGSSPQDYAAALAWLSVLAKVEDEVLASPVDVVGLIVKGLKQYSSTVPFACNVFHETFVLEFLIDENGWVRATLSSLPQSTIDRAIELLRRIKSDGWKS